MGRASSGTELRKSAPWTIPTGGGESYDGGLAPVVETDGWLDAIVPFRQLLGL